MSHYPWIGSGGVRSASELQPGSTPGPNKRASGKGGIGALFHAERAWPALPEHER